jgi:hypothetical protein
METKNIDVADAGQGYLTLKLSDEQLKELARLIVAELIRRTENG